MELTPQERKRRSLVAKKLNQKVDPVTGRRVFGGPQPGSGRPKKKRVTETLNEKIEQNADKIFDKLDKALDSDDEKVSLKAAETMVNIAVKEIGFQKQDEKAVDEMSDEDLMSEVQARLFRLHEAGKLDLEEYIEGEAVDIDPEELTT